MSQRRRQPFHVRVEALEERVVLGFLLTTGGETPPVMAPPPVSCPFPAAPGSPPAGGSGPASPPMMKTNASSGQGPASTTGRPVRHFDGLPVITSTDLRANALGLGWGHTRSWTALNNSGLNGNGWAVVEQPYLVVAGGVAIGGAPGGNPLGTGYLTGTAADDRITLVAGGTSTYSFTFPGAGPYTDTMYAYVGSEKVRLERTADPTPALRLTDAQGNVTEFYDVRRDGNGKPLFNSSAEDLPQKYGRFKSYTPAGGQARVEATYDGSGYLTAVTIKNSSGAGVERLAYAYAAVTNDLVTAAGGTVPTLLASVTLQQPDGAGGWTSLRRASYDYYTGQVGASDDPNGRLGDLRQVVIENAAGTGGATSWQAIDAKYYRYYKLTGEGYTSDAAGYYASAYGPTNVATTTGGPAPLQPETIESGGYDPASTRPFDQVVSSGLKTVVEGVALARLAATFAAPAPNASPVYWGASDAAIQPYVNHFFKYERWADHVGADGVIGSGPGSPNNGNNHNFRTAYRHGTLYRVVEEIAQESGCSSCSGGQGTYKYEYAANYGSDGLGYHTIESNTWRMRTTEYLPDGTAAWWDNDRQVTYTNEIGQPMLDVFVDVEESGRVVTGMAIVEPPAGPDKYKIIEVTSAGHGFQTGDRVAITGMLSSMYNGVFTVTRVDASTFRFNLPFTAYGQGFNIFGGHEHPPDPVFDQAFASRVLGEWSTYYRYDQDNQGRLVLTAEPSAVSGYDDRYADLVHYDVSGNAEYLRDDAGLIHFHCYYVDGMTGGIPATATTPGDVEGYLHATFVQRGELGTRSVQRSWHYYARAAGGTTVYPVAVEWAFGLDSGTAADFSDRDPRATTYTYTWHAGTTLAESITVSRPVVSSAQNGPGTADVETTAYDAYGRATWHRDGDGFLHYTAYDDATGAVVKSIVDVDTVQAGDFSGLPSGWSTPSGGGLHLVTTAQVDGLGREVKRVDPAGHVTWTVYLDANHEYRTYRGWDAATRTTTGPIEVVREYWPLAGAPAGEREMYGELLTTSATPTYDAITGAPTGLEVIAAGNIQGLVRHITNAGGQIIEVDEYFALAGVTYAVAAARLGAASNDSTSGNYHKATYGYDHRGRRNRVGSPTGTITRTVHDGLGRVVETWIGTDDTGATHANPAGSGGANNMVRVASYEYDGNGVGDGNLTELTEYPGGSGVARVTAYAYDWRDRLVAMKSGVEATEAAATNRPIVVYTLDNLGAVTAVAQYDGDGVTLGTTPPLASLLRAYSEFRYDAQGRAYQTLQYGVDPATGAKTTGALTTGIWYDHRGNAIKVAEPGGLVTKWQHDGAGRLIREFTTDGGGDASWADAGTVAGDTVLVQVETAYDAASNAILVTTRERFHDNASTATGPLGDPTTGPKARVGYRAYYYDAADRLTAAVDVGTNGGAAYTRPATVPARSDAALVTSYQYDAAGRVERATDPRGIVTRSLYDLLGRATRTIAAYDAAVNLGLPTASANKTTATTYDGAGHVLTVTAVMPAGTPGQTTRYVYGASTAAYSAINSNDLLVRVDQPDGATGAAGTTAGDRTAYVYNAQGDVIGMGDGNGTAHAYDYDVLGRRTGDSAWLLGAGVDGSVRYLATAYDGVGRASVFTSLDAGATNVVNQVRRDYNGLGQLVAEYQAHGGVVDVATTPAVRYAYGEMAGGANHSRLARTTYPDGRVVHTTYNSGLDDAIGRVSALADDSGGGPGTLLETYDYLGLDTIVRRGRPEPGIDLSYIRQPGDTAAIADAGDPYTGLDRFGRVVDQNWVRTSGASAGSSVDRFQYGHDRGGNRLFKANLVESALSELYRANSTQAGDANAAYDPLGRLTAFRRGTLSASGNNGAQKDTVATASRSQSWDLDAVGNWSGATTDGATTTRSFDAQNQVTATSGALLTAYDHAGNQVADANGSYVYDAWNRLVAVRSVAAVPTVSASGFESAAVGTGTYVTAPTGVGTWTFTGDAGVASNGSAPMAGTAAAPEGSDVGWIQWASSAMQSVGSWQAGTYQVVLSAAQAGAWLPALQTIEVLIDGSVVGTITPSGSTFTDHATAAFSVSAGVHTLTLRGTSGSGQIALVDDIRVRAAVPTVSASGFESAAVGAGSYDIAPTGVGTWTFSGYAGVASNGSAPMAGTSNAPEGSDVGWIQWASSAMQSVGDWQAGTYQLVLSGAQRGSTLPALQSIEVRIDGVLVGTITPSGSTFADYATASFTVAAGTHTLSLVGTSSSGQIALVDDIRVVKQDATRATYAYDALGRRMVETSAAAGTTDHLYYSPGWQVIEERRGGTASSNVTKQYVWGQGYVDQLVLRDGYTGGVRTERLYAQQDANYNVTSLVDASGAVQERYVYDPYGLATVLTAAGTPRSGNASAYGWKYLHQGGRQDGVTGWLNFRNRDYIAAEGRWAQRDPLGLAAGDLNLYRYVGNRPTNHTDPKGLQGEGSQGSTGNFIVNDYGPKANLVNWIHSCFSRPYPGTAIDAESLDAAVNQILGQLGPNDRIGSLQFWGHGSPASVCVGKNKIRLSSDPKDGSICGLDNNNPLTKLQPYLDKDSKVVFKTCNTFQGPKGKKFAQEATKFFGCTVGGHTDFIGKWLQYPGYQELKPGETPSWPDGKGSGEKEVKPKPKDKDPVEK